MPAPTTPTQRSAAEIEAELESIDNSLRQKTVAEVQQLDDGTNKPADQQSSGTSNERNFEYEAGRRGWKPEADYKGPAGTWVDAKTFVERGDRFADKQAKEISKLRAQVDAFDGTRAQFLKFFKQEIDKRDREHAEALQSLRVQRSSAQADGDHERVVEIEDRITATEAQRQALKKEGEELVKEKPAEEPPEGELKVPGKGSNPVLDDWVEEGNQWVYDDAVLADHFIQVGRILRKGGEQAIGRAFLEIAKKQVMEDFPRRFKTSSGPRNATSESGGQSNAGSSSKGSYNGKTEHDLPKADLELMRQFVAEGLYTKETFLKSYFSR
jgi:hypothetical protein